MFDDPTVKLTLIRYIIWAVFLIASELILVGIMYSHNKIKGIKVKKSFYDYVFFFGIITIIISIKKLNKSADPSAVPQNVKKYKIRLIFLIILYIALFIAEQIISRLILYKISTIVAPL